MTNNTAAASTLFLEEGRGLTIEITALRGLTEDQSVKHIMDSGNAFTIAMLSNDIQALGGKLPKADSKKETYARVYAQTLLNFVAESRMRAEQQATQVEQEQSSAASESPVAEQTNTITEEESNMTQENNNQQTPITAEVFVASMQDMVDSIIKTVDVRMANQSNQIAELFTSTNERIDNSAKEFRQLEQRIIQLEQQAKQQPVIIEAQQSTQPAQVAAVEHVANDNEIVYTDTQMKTLEKAKAISADFYEKMKKMIDESNVKVNNTVGGVRNGTANLLHSTANTIAEGGHKGVDTVADFLDNTIDAAKGLIYKATDFTAEAAHVTVGVARNAGHVVINGVVFAVDNTGRLIEKK